MKQQILRTKLNTTSILSETIEDKIIDFSFTRKNVSDKNIVIYFPGAAIIKNLKQYPYFLPILSDENVITISDPFYKTIIENGKEKIDQNCAITSWFTLLQGTLERFIQRLITIFNFEKVIFIGASSGGFAALYYSYNIDQSICIAINPQINISDRLSQYPSLLNHQVDNQIDIMSSKIKDVTTLYEKGSRNSVIYIMNTMSSPDINHSTPFLFKATRSPKYKKNFFIKSDFWGVHGHSGSIPQTEYQLWINASIQSTSSNVRDIANRYWEIKNNIKTKQYNNIADRIAEESE